MGVAYQQLTTVVQGMFIANSYFNITDVDAVDYPSAAHPAYADVPIDTGTSIFADATQSTAAACNFTVRKKRNAFDVSNIAITAGFNDRTGSDDKTFQIYTDAGLGWDHTALFSFLTRGPRRNIR